MNHMQTAAWLWLPSHLSCCPQENVWTFCLAPSNGNNTWYININKNKHLHPWWMKDGRKSLTSQSSGWVVGYLPSWCWDDFHSQDTLGVWTGGTPGIGGLIAVLLVLLFTLLFIMLLVMLFIVLLGMLVAVFILLGVLVFGLLVLIWFFILVVFVPFILGFIGATSLVALGSGSGDGLRSGVVVSWCGLLVRGAVKELTWGCNADATGRQNTLGTNVEVKEQQNIKKNKRRGEGVHMGFASKWGGDLRAASSQLQSWVVFLWKSLVGTNGGEDHTGSMAIILNDCHWFWVYAPLGRCPCPPLLSPLSSPSLHLHGLFLVVGPLVGVFFIVVVIIILPTAAVFDWQFVHVGHLALPWLCWGSLLLGRHVCMVVGLNEVWWLGVEQGGMWWMWW